MLTWVGGRHEPEAPVRRIRPRWRFGLILSLLSIVFLFFERLLKGLDKKRGFLVSHHLGGIFVGGLAIGVVKRLHLLIRVVVDCPNHFHAHHLSRACASLGFSLGLGFLLLFLGSLFVILVGLLLVAGLISSFGSLLLGVFVNFFLFLVLALFILFVGSLVS